MPVREFFWDGSSWGNDEPGFILGVTEPTRDNTGAGTDDFVAPTIEVNNNVNVLNGEIYKDRIINGYVNLYPGGTLQNCIVRGKNPVEAGRPLVFMILDGSWDGTTVGVVDHCTLQPLEAVRAQGCPVAVGIKGYRVSRTKILDCIDGFTVSGGATAPNVSIEGCYVSDMVALNPDPWGYWPATHNDIIQHHGSTASFPASSVSVVGNSFDCRPSAASNVTIPEIVDGSKEVSFAAIMHSKPTGVYSATFLDRNWLRGGNQTLQSADSTIVATLVATGNRWERGTNDGGSPPDGLPFVAAYMSRTSLGGSSTPRLTWTGNVWLSGGEATPYLYG